MQVVAIGQVELLLGWPRANRAEEHEFLLADIESRPEIGPSGAGVTVPA